MLHRIHNLWKSITVMVVLATSTLWMNCSAPNQTNNTNNNQTQNNNNQQQVQEPEDQRVKIPEPFAEGKGMQFVQPEAVIKAGQEKMICWIPSWVPDKDYYVTAFQGIQGKMGHHVVALRSGIPRKEGTQFDCTDIEQMTSIRPLVLPDPHDRKLLPEGYAVRVPKDTKLVFQSHYVNTSTKDIKIADVARITFAPANSQPKVASYLILNHGTINLPVGKSTVKVQCQIKNTMEILLLLGHMHEYGTKIKIDLARKEQVENLYNIDQWLVDYRDLAPITFYGPAALQEKTPKELKLQAGDTINMQCDYNNTTKGPVRFPAEMCTMVAYYHSQETSDIITCDEEN